MKKTEAVYSAVIITVLVIFYSEPLQAGTEEYADIELLKGFDAAANGNLDRALDRFYAATRQNPNSWKPFEALGGFYYCLGEFRASSLNYQLARNRVQQKDGVKQLLDQFVSELEKADAPKPTLERVVDCSKIQR